MISQPMETIFTDTLAVADSMGSFFGIEVSTIDSDPWTGIITKATKFQNAVLKLSRVNTTETRTQIDWLISAGAFILGLLAAIILLR